jgi:diadenosine tetraphosphatase ApaH/serine/threonine PP2A family protein phosphatase
MPRRVAAIYDIHGNLPALEAVLDEVRAAAPDLVVVGGDVSPGPMPRECLDRLLALEWPIRFITGNGDRETLARMRGVETDTAPAFVRPLLWWAAEQLGSAHLATLESWPKTCEIEIDGLGAVLFCHATPLNDTDIFTRETPDEKIRRWFDAVRAPLVVCGHTHMPFDRAVGPRRVVNAGSVGMPFNGPGADWLLLGPGVEPRHTVYDLAAAADRIRATAYPLAEQFADRNVLHPPTEAESLAMYAKM